MGCGEALQRKSERTGRNADGSDAGSVCADDTLTKKHILRYHNNIIIRKT